ncbi:MAG: nucleoid-associated protein [Verrucomicrobiae bacterium]|nr:nucleoid-associated protein [Verrucomicrobiae bacterium]
MRFLTNITVEQAIAHHLDHLTPEKLVSKRPLKLTQELHLYLSEHLVAISRMSGLLAAQFADVERPVAAACLSLLEGKSKFVPAAGAIAERLFEVMEGNRALSPGLLLVAVVKEEETKERFLAILKVESQPVFKEERKTSVDGEPFIELALDPAALPAPGRNLQKCAMIRGKHSVGRPQVLLIDRQARDAGVADFFHGKFLEANLCRDAHLQTRTFVREFVKWANRAKHDHRLSPDELDETVDAARDALRQKQVSVPDLVREHVPKGPAQGDCLEFLSRKQVDATVETERKAAEKFQRARVIKLDLGAQLRVPHAATLAEGFYKAEADPDDPTLTVVTLRSRKFQVS